jgi:large subunit ribosomal protein L17
MRRNLAQSLFQYGQVETTLIKAKEVRPFVERLITLAKRNTLPCRQRIVALLGDRAAISKDEQEKYDAMTDAQRHKVLRARSGRRHRSGKVPAGYNKKKIPFVAHSVVDKLVKEIGPKFAGRPGGYTRIIRLSTRRIGDASDLALLQLVGDEERPSGVKKTISPRRQKALDRVHFVEGKGQRRRPKSRSGKASAAPPKVSADSPTESQAAAADSAVEREGEAPAEPIGQADQRQKPEA